MHPNEPDQVVSVPWHPRYRSGVLALLAAVPYKATLWEWEFESNPFGKRFDPVLMINGDDQVVGFNGVMPVEVTERGVPLDALWSCDFHVAASWRGLGLGSRIKAELHRKAKTIMAFGISDQASVVLQHLGWRPDHSVHNYRLIRKRQGWRDWASTSLQWINRFQGIFIARPTRPSMTVSSELPDEQFVDSLWNRVSEGYPRVVKRNFAYLNWRYQRHPLARYAFLCAWQGAKLRGLLVLRYHRETLRIVDYSGPYRDFELKRALIRQALKHWRHARQVSAVTSDAELGQCLKAEGFFRPRSRPRFFVYEASGADFRGSHHWFLMAGDSDGDMLGAAADFSAGSWVE